MKLLIRIVLVVLAIPVLLFATGFVATLLGIADFSKPSDPEAEVTAQAGDTDVPETASEPYRKPIEGDEDAGATVANSAPLRFDPPPLPDPLDETAALQWLSDNQLLRVREGLIEVDAARFSHLSSAQALGLLWAFKKAQDKVTGDRRKQMQLLAGYVFIGAAFLPEPERLAFAQDGQLVAWSGSGSDRFRSGEFVLMFYLKGEPDQARAEAAIRQFAPMLPGSDILSALDRVGAIKVSQYHDDQWTYDMDRISHLMPETLQTLRDFIGPLDRFDAEDEREFRYAKERLDDLIADRRRETGQ